MYLHYKASHNNINVIAVEHNPWNSSTHPSFSQLASIIRSGYNNAENVNIPLRIIRTGGADFRYRPGSLLTNYSQRLSSDDVTISHGQVVSFGSSFFFQETASSRLDEDENR